MLFLKEVHSSPFTFGKPSVNWLVLLSVYPWASTLKAMDKWREVTSNGRPPCGAWYLRNHPPESTNYIGWNTSLTPSHLLPQVSLLLNVVSATTPSPISCPWSGGWCTFSLSPCSPVSPDLEEGPECFTTGLGQDETASWPTSYKESSLPWGAAGPGRCSQGRLSEAGSPIHWPLPHCEN